MYLFLCFLVCNYYTFNYYSICQSSKQRFRHFHKRSEKDIFSFFFFSFSFSRYTRNTLFGYFSLLSLSVGYIYQHASRLCFTCFNNTSSSHDSVYFYFLIRYNFFFFSFFSFSFFWPLFIFKRSVWVRRAAGLRILSRLRR